MTAGNEAQTVEDDFFLLISPLVDFDAKSYCTLLCFAELRHMHGTLKRKLIRHICHSEGLGIYGVIGQSGIEDMDLVIRIYGLHVVYDLRAVF